MKICKNNDCRYLKLALTANKEQKTECVQKQARKSVGEKEMHRWIYEGERH